MTERRNGGVTGAPVSERGVAHTKGSKPGSVTIAAGAGVHDPLFPPRSDRRRLPLPEVHRRVSKWLRREAVRELIELGLIVRYYSPKLQL